MNEEKKYENKLNENEDKEEDMRIKKMNESKNIKMKSNRKIKEHVKEISDNLINDSEN